MSSPAVVAGIALLGGLGAVARYALDAGVMRRAGAAFHWGTLAVNLTGTVALGLLVRAGTGGAVSTLVAVGFLGAFTTFSTWMLETVELARRGRRAAAVLNVAASLGLGLILAGVAAHA